MSAETLGIMSVVIAVIALMTKWVFAYNKKKSERLKSEFDRISEIVSKSEAQHSKDLKGVEDRLRDVELYAITSAQAQEMIDNRITPISDSLKEIKENNKKISQDVTRLLMGVSQLVGQLGTDNPLTNK